jgi:hypothetical protein
MSPNPADLGDDHPGFSQARDPLDALLISLVTCGTT